MAGEFNFDLKQLRSFLEVVREKSFTRASRNLRVGQATISNHIAGLEEALGVELIIRSSKDFSLTREGEIFTSFCENLFKNIDALKAELRRNLSVGSAVVGASTIPSLYIIPPAIGAARRAHPEYKYRVEVADSREIVEMVKEGVVELGVVGRMLKHPALKYVTLLRDELVLIAPRHGFPDAIAPIEIASLPLITREKGSGTRDAYERALAERNVAPSDLNVVLECATSESVREAVCAGIGAAFISRLALRGGRYDDQIKEVRVKGFSIVRDFYCVHLKKKALSGPAEALMSALMKQATGGLTGAGDAYA